LIEAIHAALYCSKICSYAQGFQLMREAQKEYGWTLDFGEIAQIFRGGCIIRAVFLQKITEAFERDGHPRQPAARPLLQGEVEKLQATGARSSPPPRCNGVPAPCMGSALSYYDGYRSEKLPANLLQGQRDYFGAHTYERTDQPRGKFFHIDWPEPGREPTLTRRTPRSARSETAKPEWALIKMFTGLGLSAPTMALMSSWSDGPGA
jgi:6-phosphogluconate dehydrogenase